MISLLNLLSLKTLMLEYRYTFKKYILIVMCMSNVHSYTRLTLTPISIHNYIGNELLFVYYINSLSFNYVPIQMYIVTN